MKKDIIFKFLFFFVIINLTSCYKKTEVEIVIDDIVPLSLAPDVSWAVISDPYAAYKTEKSWDSESKTYCRKGDILKVIGKSTDENNNEWYKFEGGWLPASCLSVYSNRYKAQTVSKSFDDSIKK